MVESDTAEEVAKRQGVIGVFLFGGFVIIRLLGLSALFNYPHPANPLYISWIRNIGLFIFYDAIILSVLGLICSVYLFSRVYIVYSIEDRVLKKIDSVAVYIIGGICLIYIIRGLIAIIG